MTVGDGAEIDVNLKIAFEMPLRKGLSSHRTNRAVFAKSELGFGKLPHRRRQFLDVRYAYCRTSAEDQRLFPPEIIFQQLQENASLRLNRQFPGQGFLLFVVALPPQVRLPKYLNHPQ